MITKSEIIFIKSLSDKKNRDKESLFVVEGAKITEEIIKSNFDIVKIYHTYKYNIENGDSVLITEQQMQRMSHLKTPSDVLVVAKKNSNKISIENLKESLSLALDQVQDPGNLGTIIRIADWFGIKNIICSSGCVDMYNNKVLQSTMGAFLRVNVDYVDDLQSFLLKANNLGITLFGTFLDGQNIYDSTLSSCGIIVMGNEGKGVCPEIEKIVSNKLFIPPFPHDCKSSESLNVSVATAIVCAEFRRRKIK